MKTDTYFRQFKINLLYGVRIFAIPALLINIIILLFLSIGLDQAMWDVDFIGSVIISLLIIAPFLLASILGIVIISFIVSSNKRLPNIMVFILGALIGIVIVAILFRLWSYEFTSLPSVSTVLLLAYVGQRMNRLANLDSSLEVELRGGLWMVLVALIGSLTFVLTSYKVYWAILDSYIYLGKALSLSLPFAVLLGFFIGFIIKKIQRPA